MLLTPFKSLLYSRKFLVLMLDTIISIVLFFVGKYTSPQTAEDVNFLILTLQPVFATIIAAIAYEDANVTIK